VCSSDLRSAQISKQISLAGRIRYHSLIGVGVKNDKESLSSKAFMFLRCCYNSASDGMTFLWTALRGVILMARKSSKKRQSASLLLRRLRKHFDGDRLIYPRSKSTLRCTRAPTCTWLLRSCWTVAGDRRNSEGSSRATSTRGLQILCR
jgi:hypothetical protein